MSKSNTNGAVTFVPTLANTEQPLALSLQELLLTGRITPAGAKLHVRHTFRSAHDKPVEVVYAFMLPRDGALRRFRIVGKDFRVNSELKPVKEAVREYEQALEQGSLAGLARTYRDGLVNLNLGNLRPDETVVVWLELLAGVELHERGFRFRFPFTVAPAYHSQMRAVEVAPGVGEIELPEEFGDVLLPTWTQDAQKLHAVGFNLKVSLPGTNVEISSPSHAVRVRQGEKDRFEVSLAPERDVPNRDLVLDARSRESLQLVSGGPASNGKRYFAVNIPASVFGKVPEAARRIVFVLDRSGSMAGLPLEQAKRALLACLGALSEKDQFSIVAFDHQVECSTPNLVLADAKHREQAREFLGSIDSRGGTELAQGIQAAASILGDGGGDVLVITDGQVFGTEDILASVRGLAIRIHALGIGSASQDRFLAQLARESKGISRFLTPRERVSDATLELFAAVGRPVADQVRWQIVGPAEARIAPEPSSLIHAGSTVLVFVEVTGDDPAVLQVSWLSPEGAKQTEIPLNAGTVQDGEIIRLMQGARLINDLESRITVMPSIRETESEVSSKEEQKLFQSLKQLSQEYGLASRAMALVAVVQRTDDVPGQLPHTQVVPVGLPQDVEFGAYFRSNLYSFTAYSARLIRRRSSRAQAKYLCSALDLSTWDPMVYGFPVASEDDSDQSSDQSSEDVLFTLAGLLEPDGGMPARIIASSAGKPVTAKRVQLRGKKDAEGRWLATALALMCFLQHGHTLHSGQYRHHVQRLLDYLQNSPLTIADSRKQDLVARLSRGEVPTGDWEQLSRRWLQGEVIRADEFWARVNVSQP
ncbi:MAG: VWA domain-containing protein [Gemmatales bacterium]|nr:VWA domain-containing protein [Gemmatales bacterium]